MIKMQIVRYLFLISITSIVFLHAIIPHSHHAEMTQEQHQCSHQEANGLLDYFGLVFQEGFNSSLELYLIDAPVSNEQIGNQDFDFLGSAVSIQISEGLISLNQAIENESDNLFHQIHFSSYGLRAPPL